MCLRILYLNLPINCQLKLSDKVINPILLFSYEVWGYKNLDIIEKVHFKFLKFILNLKSSTPNCIVYGKTRKNPLSFFVKIKIVMYWAKVLPAHDRKLTGVINCYFYRSYKKWSFIHLWIKCVHEILNSCGLSYVLENQTICSYTRLKSETLRNWFIQDWRSLVDYSTKSINNIFSFF